jgi:hypothetical protein
LLNLDLINFLRIGIQRCAIALIRPIVSPDQDRPTVSWECLEQGADRLVASGVPHGIAGLLVAATKAPTIDEALTVCMGPFLGCCSASGCLFSGPQIVEAYLVHQNAPQRNLPLQISSRLFWSQIYGIAKKWGRRRVVVGAPFAASIEENVQVIKGVQGKRVDITASVLDSWSTPVYRPDICFEGQIEYPDSKSQQFSVKYRNGNGEGSEAKLVVSFVPEYAEQCRLFLLHGPLRSRLLFDDGKEFFTFEVQEAQLPVPEERAQPAHVHEHLVWHKKGPMIEKTLNMLSYLNLSPPKRVRPARVGEDRADEACTSSIYPKAPLLDLDDGENLDQLIRFAPHPLVADALPMPAPRAVVPVPRLPVVNIMGLSFGRNAKYLRAWMTPRLIELTSSQDLLHLALVSSRLFLELVPAMRYGDEYQEIGIFFAPTLGETRLRVERTQVAHKYPVIEQLYRDTVNAARNSHHEVVRRLFERIAWRERLATSYKASQIVALSPAACLMDSLRIILTCAGVDAEITPDFTALIGETPIRIFTVAAPNGPGLPLEKPAFVDMDPIVSPLKEFKVARYPALTMFAICKNLQEWILCLASTSRVNAH